MHRRPTPGISPSSQPRADGHPIVLFDGVCNFCNASVNFILARDRAGHIRFAALQSDAGQAVLGELRLPQGFGSSLVLIEGGRAYTESTGALRIAAYLERPWSWLRHLLMLPAFLRDPAYRFVAARRYRWFGRRESCRVPTGAERERFLA